MKEETKFRLLKHIDFLGSELKDYDAFRELSWMEYNEDRSKRRNVERWIENIINSTVDISKIILSAEGRRLPDTYKETVALLCVTLAFGEDNSKRMADMVRLKNVISHEYLDIRWASIKKFITETQPLYEDFLDKAKEYFDKRATEDEA